MKVLLFILFISQTLAAQSYCNGQKMQEYGYSYYPNGQRIEEYGYKYFPNGQRVEEYGYAYYPNGQRVKEYGYVYYPNGQRVKEYGYVYYPNGQRVKEYGYLYYPNGQRVKEYGDLYYPNGSRIDAGSQGVVEFEGRTDDFKFMGSLNIATGEFKKFNLRLSSGEAKIRVRMKPFASDDEIISNFHFTFKESDYSTKFVIKNLMYGDSEISNVRAKCR